MLKKTSKKYEEIYNDIYDELIPFFDEFNIIGNKVIYGDEKKRLKRKYTRHKWYYKLAKLYALYYISKPIITESDKLFLQSLDLLENNYKKCDNINVGLMSDISELGYGNCLKDIKKEKTKSKAKKYANLDYTNAKLINDATRIVNQAKNKQELDLKKIKNEWINVKDGKFSGHLEVEAEKIYNDAYLRACEDYDIKEVEFIAVIDARTTHMCSSLDGQRFKVHGYNTFSRYYESAKKEERTTVYGLKEGINLPPISDRISSMPFIHHCSNLKYDV